MRNYIEGSHFISGSPNIFLDNSGALITFFYSDDCNTIKYLDTWAGQNNRGAFRQSLQWQHNGIHEDIWSTNFQAIGFYNMILFELDKFKSNDQNENERISGEAKVMRAYSFFKLLQLYSPYKENRLGLPINTNPDKVSEYDRNRQTQSQNYAFIISELEEVLNYKATPQKDYNVFYNKTFINGLLAQIYLYKAGSGAGENADYEKSIQYAQAVLSAGITYDYVKMLPGSDSWFKLYQDKSYAPLVFVYNESETLQSIVGNVGWDIPMYPSDNLYALFQNNDKRKKDFFRDDRAITKYESEFPYGFLQITLCSGAEMKLIIAESQARLGQESQAQQTLKEFSQTRYDGYVAPQASELLQRILDERRKEFCFEPYMRWLDVRRLGVRVEHTSPINSDNNQVFKLDENDYRFTMPIPKKAELKDNNIEQNPGWNNF